MLDSKLQNSREYKEYKESLGKPFRDKVNMSLMSGGHYSLKNVSVFINAVDILETTPWIYSKTSIIGKALTQIKYEE